MINTDKNTILVIDDEPANFIFLKDILNPEYTVYGAIDGKTGITAAKEKLPDIILLDVLMPDMDGYEVLSILKKTEKTCEIPVIFITGLNNEEAEEKGLSLGAEDYILKPFNSVLVKLRVRNLLKLVDRARVINERLKQQALMTKISQLFLSSSFSDSLLTDTLRMVGGFMKISQVILLKYDGEKNVFIQQNKWIDPKIILKMRLSERIEPDEKILTIIESLNSGNENDFCLHSDDLFIKNALEPYRINFKKYIMTPVFVKGKMFAILDFSAEDDGKKWSESEKALAIHTASIISSAFERDAIERQFSIAEYSRKIAEHCSLAKSDFLARMSHEMLTPLNAIMGFAELAKTSGDADEIVSWIDNISKSSVHLLTMLRNVLDVSDGSSAFTIAESQFSVKSLIKYVLNKTNPERKKKGQELSLYVSQSIPKTLIGDEKRIAQVIIHLMTNAVKFSPKQSKINLDIGIHTEDDREIMLKIEVTDNGIGISKEYQECLFDLFEQADGSKTRKYGGIGIGLPLSKCIAKMMDGDIFIESEPGEGSKFIFTCKVKKRLS